MDDDKMCYAYLTEVLENQYLVVATPHMPGQWVYFKTDSEIEAYKRFKEVKYPGKRLLLADLQMMGWDGLDSEPWIYDFTVIKRLV